MFQQSHFILSHKFFATFMFGQLQSRVRGNGNFSDFLLSTFLMSAVPRSLPILCVAALRRFVPGAVVSRCSNPYAELDLLDHFVGSDEQHRRDFETKRPGGSQVDHQIEPGRLHDR